ncbi:nucleoprotein TPR [Trichonephila inaurata madagascariensis]|uniref:Nucleoprotein TPR n=1 Tax=Trichonephila inaurata madagascariensis TaxID=2747483 RepID=A0A8X7BNX0_9ARAC|nr:nucleoprotein TPR [Trichonephila inaurata madagascariensis]
MEGCAKLESFLEEQELISIPEITKEKVIERFSNLNQLVAELRNENSELKVILESEQFKFEKEISASRQQLQQSTELCTKLKLHITELEESQSSIQKQWRDLQKVQDSSSLELQSVKRDNELLNQEKRSLSEQLEKRRNEIEKLNDDVRSLLDQVNSANEAKFAAIASVEEVKVKESSLQHQVNRLQQEKELLTQQINDLNAELTLKSNEIHTLKREKCNSNLELKTLLEDRVEELRTSQKKTELYKSIIDERNTRIEQLADKIRQLNEVISKSEEQFQYELSTQTKLIDLYKAASEDNQKRVQELMRAFEEAQKLLKESNDSCEDMEKHCAEVENKCKAQLEEKQNEITKLKDELRRVKEAAHGLNQDTIEKIFPVAAATSKVLHSGITLTELYVEYTRIQEELQIQKDENANLTRELKQIISEIEEKTPIINQRMLEYDKMNETISSLKSRLANSMSEFDQVLQERNDINRLYNLSERENTRLKLQVTDLNKQVQVLLKEVEEARGGVIKNDRGSFAMNEEEVTSSDDITAAKVISRHLVTFRDIEEIQRKNQKLLVAIRDLSEQHEELEKKLSTEITNKFEKEIASLSEQLGDLQKKRTKQSEMIETIIRQRDMYRVLLTSQGFSETLLGQTDGSSTLLQKSSEFSPDPQLKEAKAAMTQLQAEFDRYKKEKSENERLLTEQVDQMRSTISDLKIEKARLASQCDYYDERMKMLQSNLDLHEKEHASSKDKNNQLTTLIVQHQQNINSMRQDLMIAQEKAAQAKVTIENLKAERDLLKSVETRLLQEKESVIKEQQHQSRMMANLQTVQNNLERIESETKRNLQYQVEKYEKENAILKTKLENAHEEYRSAVKVWEKQKKEMQVKIDAEVERSRKIHEDLIDAYSQVHALNQDLVNTKSQLTAERPASAESPIKTPPKTVVSNAQTAAEVKMLKEQLNEAQVKLKTLQDKLSLTGKSAEQYQNMCKDLELRVKEQDEINKHLKESMESALKSSNEARAALEKNLENIEKNNRELIEENMKLSQDSNSQVNELQKKLTEILKTMEDYKNQAETSKNTADQAREDCQNQIKLMKDVQDKYERELMLHAQDIQALTELKEKHQKCSVEIENLTEKAKSAEQTLSDSRESWARQEETLRSEIEALKTKIADFETCNSNLHHQLELMGTQMAALQSKNWEETSYSSIQSDLKDTQHLLQVIQFIKKEKEIASTQLDMVQSENIRLTLKVDQLTNDLSGAKAELKDIMNDVQAKATSEAQHTELLKKIEMMNLLSESNNLLRMEKESLSEAKAKLEIQLQELTEKFQPLNEKEKEMNLQIDMLSAENNALRLEVKSWQSRTNQLLEQSHRIGPQEYKNMSREIEELKSQKSRLTEELQRKQAEASQVTASMTSLKKELDNLRNELKQKSDEIARLNEKIIEDQKTLLQIKKIGRKYKTQFDELKVSYDALLVKAEASDSSNQEQIVQEMQKKVEESDKIVKELKEEINKQKESTNQAKKEVDDVQSKANEKEEKAKKLLAQFRQKYSQLNVQKDTLASENSVLAKEVEEYKTKLSTYMQAQEDNALLKSQSEARIALLENELKRIEEIRKERDFLQKQYEELQQKVSHQKQSMKSPIVGLGERTSGGGTEPLTANIKPLTSPSTSGAAASLRHSPHPVSNVNRPTPTASIRPMAIGTSSPATSQTRMATVLPTTATPSHSEEVVPPTSVSVPHATVQPTPATATVAPTTMAVTVSPVISEVAPSMGHDDSQTSIPSLHNTGTQAVSMPVTALVPPRVDVSEQVPEAVTVDSPAPTTSVIVSPPATQTQVVTPTVKRPREESPGSSDSAENSLKRIRMVSEGSQTNQQHPTLVVVPTNVAVVPAAQIVNRSKSQTSPVREPEPSTSSIQIETEESPVLDTSTTPINSSPDEDLIAVPIESNEAEILEDDKEQVIDWELQEESKIDEDFETEGMEESTMDEVEEGEQMQGIDRSPDDEDMAEEQQDDTEEMLDQPTPTAPDIDILDSTSDTQMDADSSSQQNVSNEPCMAPPAFPPTLEIISSATPSVEPVISSVASTSAPRATLAVSAPRLERQQPVNRQHLTPFTIPGQGSNFEEGDDGIVPSTPTLYVPRRTDGFAEAVSSPHVPQVRFLFSSSDNSPTQQGLSQLASQGALGVDDTRMDLSQFDEGGRSVPSTPIQVSPPAEATVPDVMPALATETTVTISQLAIPSIKVDLAEESLDTTVSNTETFTGETTTTVTSESTPGSKDSNKSLESENKLTVPEENREPEAVKPEAKIDEAKNVQESEQTTKDNAASSSSQRKPIVWKDEIGSTSAPETEPVGAAELESAPPPGLLPTPARGRARTRRARYANTGVGYSRGRGSDNVWTGAVQRGRRTTRRRSMY